MTPRVIGLDLSLTATGIARADGHLVTVKTRPADGDRRLNTIRREIAIAVGGGNLVVIEDLPIHAKSAGITGMVHGIARELLCAGRIPYTLVPPATLKKYATGKGNCDKADMAVAAYKRAGQEFGDDNQCDAWWLRAMGLDHLGCPVAEVPTTHREALAKVAWPEVS